MAILKLTLDTETKGISVNVDGQDIENVRYVSITDYSGMYGDSDYGPSFCVETHEKVGDVSKCIRLCASESAEAKEATKAGRATASDVPGYVRVEARTKAEKSMAMLLDRS